MADYEISSERGRMDVAAIHAFLTRTYWARGIPLETVQRAIENSLCFGVFQGEAQVGFARVITDQATFAYLADVYLLDEHRGSRQASSGISSSATMLMILISGLMAGPAVSL